MTFWDKIAAVQADLRAVSKDSRNNDQGYDYTSAKDVQLRVSSALAQHGLSVVASTCEVVSVDELTTRRGSTMQRVVVKTRVEIGDGTGSVYGEGLGGGTDTLDKAPMKANTAAYKYALCAALNIAMGDDPERDQVAEEELDPSLVWYGRHRGQPLSGASQQFIHYYFDVAKENRAPAEHFKHITARIDELERKKQ